MKSRGIGRFSRELRSFFMEFDHLAPVIAREGRACSNSGLACIKFVQQCMRAIVDFDCLWMH